MGGGGGGGQGGCEELKKKLGGPGGGGGGQGGCEQRIEVFVKIQIKIGGGAVGRGQVWGVRVDVIKELKFLGKFTKIKILWGEGGLGRVDGGGGCQGGCERRIEVFVKIQKKNWGGGGGGGGVEGGGLGGGGESGWGVRVDVNKELKFLGKFTTEKNSGGGGGEGRGSGGGGFGLWGGESGWGVRVDVNKELKFLGKFTTEKNSGGGRGGGQVGGVRFVGGSGWM